MWPWRKRSPFEHLGLPRKVFISHSYKDAETRERLLALLPKGVEPFIFPPITVPPEEMVSSKLLNAIQACDGLIYLKGGASAESFWVALERDYALRQSKPVFAFDRVSGTLLHDREPPLDLQVLLQTPRYFPGNTLEVVDRVHVTLKQRNFAVLSDFEKWPTRSLNVMALNEIVLDHTREALGAGGYTVFFWHKDIEIRPQDSVAGQESLTNGRPLVLALLDRSEYPDLGNNAVVVQLYGDLERPQTQRFDDLIVALYWLIHRNTRQNQLS